VAVALVSARAWGQGPPDIVWEIWGHSRTVEAVAFSPDGAVLASGADYDDNSVKLWRVSDGTLLATFTGHEGGIQSIDISPDGSLLAAGYIVNGYPSGGLVKVWDIESETVQHTFGGCHVAFSPDGEYLASGGGGANRYVQINRISDGQNIATIYTGTYISDVAYAPDGQLVGSAGSDNDIHLWNAQTGGLVRTLTGHVDDVSAIAFSPDGELIASGAGGWDNPGESTVKLWRVSDGALLDTLPGHGTWVYDVAFSPDGVYLITSGRTGPAPRIRIWRVADGDLVHDYGEGIAYGVHTVQFSPAGTLFGYGRGQGQIAVANGPAPIAGDMNCDGMIDLNDVPLFVEALLDPAAFDLSHPSCTSMRADMDGSGDPNGMDVQELVMALLPG
jgi:WD40 repeat protein